jgi:hypothetical protein
VDSQEGDRFVMTCNYVDCDYRAPTGATMEMAVKWIEMHDRARHWQPVIQQQQQTLKEKNKLVEKPVSSVGTEREQLKLKAVSNKLEEDPERGSFAKDISSEGGMVEELVGKPVIAANTGQGEDCDAEESEEIRVVSRQKVGLVEDTVDTVRMEQLLQAVSNTLVGNQGEGMMDSWGGGKVSLQCGECDYQTQLIRPKKARHRLAQHGKVFHTEVVVIPDQVEGGDFESPYLVEERCTRVLTWWRCRCTRCLTWG